MQVDASYAIFDGSTFVGVDEMNSSCWQYSRLTGTSFRRSRFVGSADFINAEAVGACFDAAQFDNALFEGANLTNASFRGAQLKDVRFVGANVTGTDFAGAELRNVTFGSEPPSLEWKPRQWDDLRAMSACFGRFHHLMKEPALMVLGRCQPFRVDGSVATQCDLPMAWPVEGPLAGRLTLAPDDPVVVSFLASRRLTYDQFVLALGAWGVSISSDPHYLVMNGDSFVSPRYQWIGMLGKKGGNLWNNEYGPLLRSALNAALGMEVFPRPPLDSATADIRESFARSELLPVVLLDGESWTLARTLSEWRAAYESIGVDWMALYGHLEETP